MSKEIKGVQGAGGRRLALSYNIGGVLSFDHYWNRIDPAVTASPSGENGPRRSTALPVDRRPVSLEFTGGARGIADTMRMPL